MSEAAAGFATTAEERDERKRHARRLVGSTLAKIRYFDLDYHRATFAPEHSGPRNIEAAIEWVDPTWRCARFDRIDYGIELLTTEGRIFTVTWDSPGWTESLGLRELPLFDYAVAEEADVAVWDVTHRSGWTELVDQVIRDVVMHYTPNGQYPGFWCPRITIVTETGTAELILGDEDGDGNLKYSADNIAVLYSDRDLPPWCGDRPTEDRAS